MDKLTPKDFKLQPIVTLYNKDGIVLATQKDQEYTPLYPRMVLTKGIGCESKDNQLVNGDVTKDTDPTRIDENRAELVLFLFYYFNEAKYLWRMMQTAYFTDTLPTYVNSQGETVTAKFDPSVNPGWTDNGDGTVSYT